MKYFLSLTFLFTCSICRGQTITSIAGNGITQFIGDGSPATAFSLAAPGGMCMDKKGNLYIADFLNSRIRRLAHDTISTIAGTGAPGYTGDGHQASAAQVGNPVGVAMDTAGNWYITDAQNNVIRKIDAHTNTITTVCGTGGAGYAGDGAAATAAQMQSPGISCVDIHGNIYIPDYSNQRIRKIDAATGVITTIAGTGVSGYIGDNGPATAAQISYPNSTCTDSAGNIYFSENGNNVIRKINVLTGIITTVAGSGVQGYSGDGSAATMAQLNEPNSVFVDKRGYLYISDLSNNVIRAVTPAGIIHTIAGTGAAGYTGDGGPATAATFRNPTAVFVDDPGYIYVADGDNSVIRKITPLVPFKDEVAAVKATVCSIFPNPCNGRFSVVGPSADPATVEVCNMLGQRVYAASCAAGKLDIDISHCAAGIYVVQYTTSGVTYAHKLVLR